MYKKIHAFPNNKSVALSAADSMQKKPIHVTLYFSKKVRFTSSKYQLVCRLIIPLLSENSFRLNSPKESCWPEME